MRKKLILPIWIVLALLAASCSSDRKPPKESDESGGSIKIQVIVAPDSNPDIAGRPSPVRLDLYQLSADNEFRQLNYSELTEQTKEKLGDKLIQHDQQILYPDSVKVFSVKLDSHLKYLGVVAGYRDLSQGKWRLVLLKQDKHWYQIGKQYLYLDIEKNTISQINKAQMREKLQDFKSRHPDDKSITNSGKARKDKNDLSKGIFREDPKSPAVTE
ncbi:MAG: type VI secretion system lipoprotein TssJ [Neisseria sp.]|uniref:type VI secretion system lipoprotein TssJ n=1 Tax=Neisseria sp. TaxID=192066 RepID=UPI0026DCE385|nr:type VI secretion system lipoprotein TssJ [Neisseria sp.]MDO4641982.1 type VI secretion system lipoprotein TssJ [Neisseria sp.]